MLGMRTSRRVMVYMAFVLAVVAPTPAAAETLGTNGAPVPALDWGPCGIEGREAYQCATAEVPLSYRDPAGQSIELAVGKLPAADPERKIGTLFYGPGGPGGSGRFAPAFSAALHERFDIVGFDPRGVHASTPLRCFASNDQAQRLFGLEFPITPAQEQTYIRRTVRGTELCARNGGPLLSHMSTANVARDLDVLRQAVGEEDLTFLGTSYGTHIGAVYANLFPDRVRAAVLDSVLDPVEWTTGREPQDAFVPVVFRLGSFLGTTQALDAFLRACAADARCAFREEGVDLHRKFDTLLRRLRERSLEITLPDGSLDRITYQRAVGDTRGALYATSRAPGLAVTLQQWHEATSARGSGAAPAEVGLQPLGSRPGFDVGGQQDEPYLGLEWTAAVLCLDSLNPSNPFVWPRYARAADRLAPYFGSWWVYVISQPCATWPASDPDRYAGPWNRERANPILLIGNSQDPATPYEDAQSTTRELGNARLLTLNTFGHVAVTRGRSSCVISAVDRYLIDQELPPEGAVCEPDVGPFDAP
jgi:pimeloyl-ACP methyl ester carboxylesterase